MCILRFRPVNGGKKYFGLKLLFWDGVAKVSSFHLQLIQSVDPKDQS